MPAAASSSCIFLETLAIVILPSDTICILMFTVPKQPVDIFKPVASFENNKQKDISVLRNYLYTVRDHQETRRRDSFGNPFGKDVLSRSFSHVLQPFFRQVESAGQTSHRLSHLTDAFTDYFTITDIHIIPPVVINKRLILH